MSALVAAPASPPLHSLPIWVDVTAMAVAAAFGAATGRNRRLPLLAVLTAGVISGLTGGMIRDVLLGLEAAAIKNWYYIPAVLLAALAGGFLAHRLVQGHVPYLLARALAVGLLVTVAVQTVAVQKGIEYQAPADAAIFLGILAGTMGAATADVLAGERAAIFRQAHWGLAAVVSSAFTFWLLTTYVGFWAAIGALHRAADGGRRVESVMFVPAALAGLACLAAAARRSPSPRCATPRASWPGTAAKLL